MNNQNTIHKIQIDAAQKMRQIEDKSVQLVVTSPPYPMIEMWDEILVKQNPDIGNALKSLNGSLAFELMHQELDKVWSEIDRVLTPSGFVCINIGDATRTLNGDFALYSNHSRIITAFLRLGLVNLPNIIWRKQTNAPNKFMGSGMLPAGAYVTLEHEWILVFRKGGKRIMTTDIDKKTRKESGFFWEERNLWFSDLWDLKGVKQKVENSPTRKRSAAYPLEIPYRLINMYSVKGDTVLDPFLGTGTTIIAAMALERNSIGIEIDPEFLPIITNSIEGTSILELNNNITNRIIQHKRFIEDRMNDPKKEGVKHFNTNLNLPVMTSQETDITLSYVRKIENTGECVYSAEYSEIEPSENSIVMPAKSKKDQLSIGF